MAAEEKKKLFASDLWSHFCSNAQTIRPHTSGRSTVLFHMVWPILVPFVESFRLSLCCHPSLSFCAVIARQLNLNWTYIGLMVIMPCSELQLCAARSISLFCLPLSFWSSLISSPNQWGFIELPCQGCVWGVWLWSNCQDLQILSSVLAVWRFSGQVLDQIEPLKTLCHFFLKMSLRSLCTIHPSTSCCLCGRGFVEAKWPDVPLPIFNGGSWVFYELDASGKPPKTDYQKVHAPEPVERRLYYYY